MSADVHHLTPAGPITEPQADVIEKLKDLLAKAERAEIKGLGYFFVDGGGLPVDGWAAGCAAANDMVAAAVLLYERVLDARRQTRTSYRDPRDPA